MYHYVTFYNFLFSKNHAPKNDCNKIISCHWVSLKYKNMLPRHIKHYPNSKRKKVKYSECGAGAQCNSNYKRDNSSNIFVKDRNQTDHLMPMRQSIHW